ncbi:MAG: hypothetical protein RL392_2033 [Pseudomonadota bacterium]|jgi:hypothetical protein
MSFDPPAGMPSLESQLHATTDVVRVNILVPSALRKEWKAMALASDKTLTDFIIEAMQHQTTRVKQTEISKQ